MAQPLLHTLLPDECSGYSVFSAFHCAMTTVVLCQRAKRVTALFWLCPSSLQCFKQSSEVQFILTFVRGAYS